MEDSEFHDALKKQNVPSMKLDARAEADKIRRRLKKAFEDVDSTDVKSDFYVDVPDTKLNEFKERILARKYVEIWESENLRDR